VFLIINFLLKEDEMTKKQKEYKKVLLKLVHTSKMYKEVYSEDRELWEEFLKRNFGVKSSKDLSINELVRLVDYLNYKTSELKEKATINQIKYMCYLWDKKGKIKGVFGLIKFIRERMRFRVLKLKDLTKEEATKIIIALEKLKEKK
jgi:hypothetical protein